MRFARSGESRAARKAGELQPRRFSALRSQGHRDERGPNQKSHMNSPICRARITPTRRRRGRSARKSSPAHRDFALGLMWFLQNDESVSAKQREGFREWGLAKDEFPDNGHIPYEMYVREARRLVGRYVFKEQDNSLAPGFARTPILPDSIAITDWYMDSHSCTKNRGPVFIMTAN
ncbi:MAG: FAD-dependent oxidoreductase [Chthoniobacter sp.]